MSQFPQPRPDDVVKGDQNPPPNSGAVLGGLEGVKRCLASVSDEVRIAALKEALKYGEEGLKLVVQIVKSETGSVQWAAYDLLWEGASRRIKQDVLKYIPLRSDIGADYTKLRDLLAARNFKEANEETTRVWDSNLLCSSLKTYMETFDMKTVPCIDLQTIDQLWVNYSGERYGFSVQKHILQERGIDYSKFSKEVADYYVDYIIGLDYVGRWLEVKKWLPSLASKFRVPRGYFPSLCRVFDSLG